MSLLRPNVAPTERPAVERTGKPDVCNACHRDRPLRQETYHGAALWLCVDYRDCNRAVEAADARARG
jgi:hypothetical protein